MLPLGIWKYPAARPTTIFQRYGKAISMKRTWITLALGTLVVMSTPASAQTQRAVTGNSTATLNRILAGEGRPGDSATTGSGITYRVLPNGTVEMRNPRYGTVKYSNPEPAWQRNLKNQVVGGH